MRRQFIRGDETGYRIAKKLSISTVTSWRYMTEFKRIKAAYPEKLNDMNFFMPEEPKQHRMTPLYVQFLSVLPRLLADEKPGVKAKPVWRKYRKLYPQGYAYLPFTELFYIWIKENDVPEKPPIIQSIPEKDLKVLKKWKRSVNRRKWQIATTLLMALETSCYKVITDKTEATFETIKSWINTYQSKGLSAFELPKHKVFPTVIKRMKARADNLIKLLHESPKMHGLNRTSWTITALADTYEKIYAEKVSWAQTSYTLQQNGYRFKKSRDMLTSQDPKFREKINRLQNILRRLKKDEKFFSIDEYGPVGVKIKGGRMLKKGNEDYQIPNKQKHKGVVICTAALELSTNQVTHFYSIKKNTFETMKLIEILIAKYSDQKRIFLCWDNVSWHRSNILLNFIKDHNEESRPLVVPMPLPSCTQFLNVIESVFSGLARTVIHNSNYDSLEDCQAAIDRHFSERNEHFKNHPRRAGNKIWGKEPVAPKFCETHKCRNRRAMRGADQK
ncbi:IS630 family transposase [Mucilaginibacter sp. cycad4]|uniref:IS630 family transposase n=1 Tax=Mucilaginibacter sp. cycad4 TaxID=3342096 RepID=UPI002AAA8988|nr:IS630 family transposase [Mucilaginibacter gossypii]WPU98397.1 IS630 family transposase [Mucilaginibacter gossypii]